MSIQLTRATVRLIIAKKQKDKPCVAWETLGVPRATVSKWNSQSIKTGTAAAKPETLARVCRGLECDPGDLKLSEADAELVRQEMARLVPAAPLEASSGAAADLRYGVPELWPSKRLVGRKQELKLLDRCWKDNGLHVVTVCATSSFGGEGKSSLVSAWFHKNEARREFEGVRVFVWVFTNQQSDGGRPGSADTFFETALLEFGEPTPNRYQTSQSKAHALVQLIRTQPTLLVLDGVQVLQDPDTHALTEDGLHTLLRELATQHDGLCVLTSRMPIADLSDFDRERRSDGTACRITLGPLDDEAGAQLLKSYGIDADLDTLKRASKAVGGHPVSLAVWARYRKHRRVDTGDLCRPAEEGVSEIAPGLASPEDPPDPDEAADYLGPDDPLAAHFRRVMRDFERSYQDRPDQQVLRLLSLFDRQADQASIDELLKPPAILGLTDKLTEMTGDAGWTDWRKCVRSLRRSGLLTQPPEEIPQNKPARPDQGLHYDSHPLFRSYLGKRLKILDRGKAWVEGHRRLFVHFRDTAADLPETIQTMQPLYRAIAHGCLAGANLDAFEVYLHRVARGETFFSMAQLGAYGDDLAAMSGFFDEPWERIRPGLDSVSKGFICGVVAFSMRARGDVGRSEPLMQRSLKLFRDVNDLRHAAQVAGYVAEIQWTLGNLDEAESLARAAVRLADQLPDSPTPPDLKAYNRTTLGLILLARGRLPDAEKAFREAADRAPLDPLPEVRFCELDLAREDYRGAYDRATASLDKRFNHRLANAYCHLWRGVAGSRLPLGAAVVEAELNAAVKGLQEAGLSEDIPLGLTERAKFYRRMGRFDEASRDLERAVEGARRCSAKILEADACIEKARLGLS